MLNKKERNEAEESFVRAYYKFLPVIDSNSVMNCLCKYIESVHLNVRENSKAIDNNIYKLYLNNSIIKNDDVYQKVLNEYNKFMKELRDLNNMGIYKVSNKQKYNQDSERTVNNICDSFKNRMFKICSNAYELTNYLIEIFYCEYKSSNKDILWNSFGKYIFDNLNDKNKNPILFPTPNDYGEIIYLNKKYTLEEVII